jgi:sugar/nucleoside kinase (ribokinase family)
MPHLDLLVLGDANPDLILAGDVQPAFGQAERLVVHDLVLGGSGAITACAAARLGAATALIGVVGDDALGRFTLDAIAERGLDTSGCRVDPGRPTGITVILAREGDRAILTSPGAIADLRSADVPSEALASATHVHVSSYFLQRGLREDLPALFERVRARGGTTSVDPNWDPAQTWDDGLLELLPLIDLFLPNEAEARAIARADDLEVAARALAARGPTIAVKDGANGGLVAEGDTLIRADARVIVPVDAIGAGDAFDAGFLVGRLNGLPLERCLRLAVACGTLSMRARGGTAAQPTMDEVRALEGVG